jgi:hypothetical protein
MNVLLLIDMLLADSNFLSIMDVDAWRLGTTAETEALERVPCIDIRFVGTNIADSIRQMLQVDDEGRPRITVLVLDAEVVGTAAFILQAISFVFPCGEYGRNAYRKQDE